MDPARFWEITPRLLSLEIRGAQVRLEREKALTWWGAMLPHMKDPIPLGKFLGKPVDDRARVAAFHAAWDKVDKALRH